MASVVTTEWNRQRELRRALARREHFGTLADGTTIEAVVLEAGGLRARIITYGATLQSLQVPDSAAQMVDVVLGYDTLEDYVEFPEFFGVTVGRYANRIAGGVFALQGRAYCIPANNGCNALHGGPQGFDKHAWRIVAVEDGEAAAVTMELASPDGDQGFPGNLVARVTYRLDRTGTLTIGMTATTDAPTIVNLTNHSFFNLAGAGGTASALDHVLTIPAEYFAPVDEGLIPTGELRAVAGTPFDFRAGRIIGDGVRDGHDAQIAIGRGYDHSFALAGGVTAEPKLAARLSDPCSGRYLELFTTDPALQVYSGNFLDGTRRGKGGRFYRMGDGIALEPQKFPDTPNKPEFGSARLDPGETYRHRIVIRLVGAIVRY